MREIKRKILGSIKAKISISIIVPIVIAVLAVGTASAISSYITTIGTLKKSLEQTAKLAETNVRQKLNEYFTAIEELSADSLFQEESVNYTELNGKIKDFVDRYGVVSVDYADENGITTKGKKISGEDYFSNCKIYMKKFMSDLIITADGKTQFVFAVPVKKNGIFRGVVFSTIDGKDLDQLATKIKIGDGGEAFILNRNGDMIVNKDATLVQKSVNMMNEAKTDRSLKSVAELHGKMTSAMGGVSTYKYKGTKYIAAYTPISDTEGWSLAVTAKESEFSLGIIISIITLLGVSILIIVGAFIASRKIAASVSRPIMTCVERIKLLAQGDVSTPVPQVANMDETGVLAKETAKMVGDLSQIIREVSFCLAEMAKGNLDIEFDSEYHGDFAPIGHAIKRIIREMSRMLYKIQEFSRTVSTGADEVSGGAQALSQGATEQASAIEELAATIGDISHKVNSNAENARKASDEVENVNALVEDSNRQMQTLMEAMREIGASSEEIVKINKTVEDIAFQTNILAINAAVEAARAGSAGRSFAVVAAEVRSLAEKSAEAAQTTTALIEKAIAAVGKGTKLADRTAKSLSHVVEGTQLVTKAIEDISNASGEQAISITEINRGVDQIATVVQTNSATAEESAAASSELTEQAKSLETLVEKFKVNQNMDLEDDGSDEGFEDILLQVPSEPAAAENTLSEEIEKPAKKKGARKGGSLKDKLSKGISGIAGKLPKKKKNDKPVSEEPKKAKEPEADKPKIDVPKADESEKPKVQEPQKTEKPKTEKKSGDDKYFM